MEFFEVIVKFFGNIENIAESINCKFEILNNNLAIFKVNEEKFHILCKHPQIQKIEKTCIIVASDRISNLKDICHNYSLNRTNLTGKGTIVAILDSGIDIKHPDFIDNSGNSRILYIWDQNKNGNPPKGFDFGTEYSNSEINMAINGEIQIPDLDTDGHGTAVAGIATGNGRSSNGKNIGVAPESNIIVVKLLTQNNSLSTSSTNLIRAVKYIAEKSEILKMPTVINISYGTNRGTHDGESLFEQYLDSISEQKNISIVVATGNEGIARHHFESNIKTGESVNIEFSISDNFREFSFVFVSSFYDYLNFRILNSSGEKSSIIDLRQLGQEFVFFEKVRVGFYLNQPTPSYEGQEIIIIFSATENYIPRNIWTLEIIGKEVFDGRIDAWLPITGISGLETQFLNSSYETTLTLPSTAKKVISVGGFNSETNEVAEFSGRGYTRDNFISPDLVAPAVSIFSTSPGGGYSNFTGTSFAAPFVSGACAILMQWGIVNKNDLTMYGQRLKAFLKLGTNKKSGVNYPNISWGYGSLCIDSSLSYAKKYATIKNVENLFLKDYIQFQSAQVSNNEEKINPVTDNNYIDFILNYDQNSSFVLEQEPNIKISSILRGKFAIIHATLESFDYYRRNLPDYMIFERAMICGLAQNFSYLEESGITEVQQQSFLQLRGAGVIIGIIDSGIDFNNKCFRYEDGKSKILYLWDQESSVGSPPQNFQYGTEYDNEKINELISDNYNVSDVDEVGHGTFMASIAAGRNFENSNFLGVAPDADIVFVKLKKAKQIMKEDSSIFVDTPCYESTDIMAGIEYIINIAAKLGKPVAINIPLQTNEGAHDGLSFFEQYISEVSNLTGVSVVVPVGNQSNKAGHLQIKVKQDESYKIEFNISNNEPGFEINIWTSVPDRISISISTPLGNTVERKKFTINEYAEYDFVLEKSKISIQYVFPDIKNGNQNIVIKFINPTAGLWNLTIYGDLILYGNIDLWMPISQFLTQGTAFLNSTLNGTVTIPSTANNIISVGAYDNNDGSIYLSSGRGLENVARTKPSFVAPGVDIFGIYPKNLEGKMTGTGVSSAIVTGMSALLLEWGIVKKNDLKMNTARIRSYLVLGCSQSANIYYPNNIWGYGKVNLIESFRKIR